MAFPKLETASNFCSLLEVMIALINKLVHSQINDEDEDDKDEDDEDEDDDDDNRIILKTCHTVAPRLT